MFSHPVVRYRRLTNCCPYYNLINLTADYIKEFTIGKWIVCGDFEQFGDKFFNGFGLGYWKKPEYSRKISQNESNTEYFRSFYSSLEYEIGQLISNHYIIKIMPYGKEFA